ncbi:HCLS1-associated protein X-1 [Alligator sinensis]|uniref:HCLS1-associated protein X-1 n=1 Tax=Alligator sinensis TaxID=38654 RepID=A0A3Q0HD66_ALLSI|nr:HCLS1-associated protein X-1 [Alligator sinensis]
MTLRRDCRGALPSRQAAQHPVSPLGLIISLPLPRAPDPAPPRPRDPFFGGITRDEDEDEDDDALDAEWDPDFRAGPAGEFGFGFSIGPGGMRFHDGLNFDQLFREFNELFHDMGVWRRPFELPGMESPPPAAGEKHGQSLRDSMLKYPDGPCPRTPVEDPDSGGGLGDGVGPAAPGRRPWQPFAGLEDARLPVPPALKEDRDLDSQVSSGGLETILRPSEPKSHSCFQSVSITTVTRPDGTVEERRTVQDSLGHRETTVTQWHRDQAITTMEPGQGRDKATSMDNWEPAWFTGIWQQPGEPRIPDLRDSSLLGGFLHRWFSSRCLILAGNAGTVLGRLVLLVLVCTE